jgi:hypothetical protein
VAAVPGVEVPYAAYLRVYEPLAAFPEPERTHWRRYAASRPAGEGRTAQDELRQALADLVPVPPVPVPVHESRDAFLATVDEVLHVCPWRTRLRGWLALEELTEQWPGAVLDAVLPPVVRRQAARDFERWRERHPDARPWIRSATWHVPVRWFVLFDDTERDYRPGGSGAAEPGAGAAAEPEGLPDSSGEGDQKQRVAPLLRYRTPMVQARRRVARGLRVLRERLQDNPMVDDLVDVGRWLEEFHPRSLVELDYGGLVHLIPESGLREDRSAVDLTAALSALRDGDDPAAEAAYARLAERWRAVRDLGSAS